MFAVALKSIMLQMGGNCRTTDVRLTSVGKDYRLGGDVMGATGVSLPILVGITMRKLGSCCTPNVQ